MAAHVIRLSTPTHSDVDAYFSPAQAKAKARLIAKKYGVSVKVERLSDFAYDPTCDQCRLDDDHCCC